MWIPSNRDWIELKEKKNAVPWKEKMWNEWIRKKKKNTNKQRSHSSHSSTNNTTELYHLNRILCCLSIFCMSTTNSIVYSFGSALVIGFIPCDFRRIVQCKQKKEEEKNKTRLAERRKQYEKKNAYQNLFWFNLCKKHKYGNKTPPSTNLHTQDLNKSSCHASHYKRIQWIKIEKIIINRISFRYFTFHHSKDTWIVCGGMSARVDTKRRLQLWCIVN